ncbi:MAG: hypothetical protein IPG17_28650 [Sandaracinaceae bacterium]|nr:hypothetical protein [Sandaracinaceae bacterium]
MIETPIAAAPAGTRPHFYRTAAGPDRPAPGAAHGGTARRWAFEVKRSLAPS